MTTKALLWLGLDVAKATFDAALPNPKSPSELTGHASGNRPLTACDRQVKAGLFQRASGQPYSG